MLLINKIVAPCRRKLTMSTRWQLQFGVLGSNPAGTERQIFYWYMEAGGSRQYGYS